MLTVISWRVIHVQFIWGKTLVSVAGEILKVVFFPYETNPGNRQGLHCRCLLKNDFVCSSNYQSDFKSHIASISRHFLICISLPWGKRSPASQTADHWSVTRTPQNGFVFLKTLFHSSSPYESKGLDTPNTRAIAAHYIFFLFTFFC